MDWIDGVFPNHFDLAFVGVFFGFCSLCFLIIYVPALKWFSGLGSGLPGIALRRQIDLVLTVQLFGHSEVPLKNITRI